MNLKYLIRTSDPKTGESWWWKSKHWWRKEEKTQLIDSAKRFTKEEVTKILSGVNSDYTQAWSEHAAHEHFHGTASMVEDTGPDGIADDNFKEDELMAFDPVTNKYFKVKP